MFKRILSFVLVTVISLILFAGCTPADSDQSDSFDAKQFIEECKVLAPASRYSDSEDDLKDFEIDFPRAVLDKFGKSEYYKNMTEDERKAAFNELTNILSTYSYGNAANGFMSKVSVDMLNHTVSWYIKDFNEDEVIWSMPGY